MCFYCEGYKAKGPEDYLLQDLLLYLLILRYNLRLF